MIKEISWSNPPYLNCIFCKHKLTSSKEQFQIWYHCYSANCGNRCSFQYYQLEGFKQASLTYVSLQYQQYYVTMFPESQQVEINLLKEETIVQTLNGYTSTYKSWRYKYNPDYEGPDDGWYDIKSKKDLIERIKIAIAFC